MGVPRPGLRTGTGPGSLGAGALQPSFLGVLEFLGNSLGNPAPEIGRGIGLDKHLRVCLPFPAVFRTALDSALCRGLVLYTCPPAQPHNNPGGKSCQTQFPS